MANKTSMICPICGKPMKARSTYTCVVWDQIEGDSEYRLDTIYTCKNGHPKVTYDDCEELWQIPTEFQPTEKQVRCIEYIIRRLGINPPIPTKTECWKFINTYLTAASSRSKYNNDYREYDDYDYAMAIPEEECY